MRWTFAVVGVAVCLFASGATGASPGPPTLTIAPPSAGEAQPSVYPGEQTAIAVTPGPVCDLLQDGKAAGTIGGSGATEYEKIVGPFNAATGARVTFQADCSGQSTNTVTTTMLAAPATGGARVFDTGCTGQPQLAGLVDPIVAPGGQAAHEHNFAGNPSTSPDSTYDSLVAAGLAALGTPSQSCIDTGDFSPYWAPQLNYSLDGGATWNPAPIRSAHIYYRGDKVLGQPVSLMPPDFAMIAFAKDTGNGAVFACGDTNANWAAPQECQHSVQHDGLHLSEIVKFPDHWDCQPRAPGAANRTTYKDQAPGYPCRVPQLSLIFDLGDVTDPSSPDNLCTDQACSNVTWGYGPVLRDPEGLCTAWDATHTYCLSLAHFYHADFFEGWDLLRLAHLDHECEDSSNKVACHHDITR